MLNEAGRRLEPMHVGQLTLFELRVANQNKAKARAQVRLTAPSRSNDIACRSSHARITASVTGKNLLLWMSSVPVHTAKREEAAPLRDTIPEAFPATSWTRLDSAPQRQRTQPPPLQVSRWHPAATGANVMRHVARQCSAVEASS